jgi:hypothetical protein
MGHGVLSARDDERGSPPQRAIIAARTVMQAARYARQPGCGRFTTGLSARRNSWSVLDWRLYVAVGMGGSSTVD